VLTCAPIANERKVILLTTAAGSDKIKDAGDYVFRNRESSTLQTDAIAKACIQRFGFNEIAILHSNAANGISYRNSFKDAVEQLGGKIVSSVGYNEGKSDYRAEIEQLRSKSPKAVFLAGLDNELGLILKQASEVNFMPQYFATAGAISQQLLDIAGGGAEGIICGSAPFDVKSDDPHVQTFASSFKARFGETPDFISANSYDAIYMIADFFKKGANNADDIKAGFYAIKDFPGVGGTTTFDRNGEVAKPIRLVVVKNGQFVPLK
jgi:branched-chain amino acid transport system substrate-binding protein